MYLELLDKIKSSRFSLIKINESARSYFYPRNNKIVETFKNKVFINLSSSEEEYLSLIREVKLTSILSEDKELYIILYGGISYNNDFDINYLNNKIYSMSNDSLKLKIIHFVDDSFNLPDMTPLHIQPTFRVYDLIAIVELFSVEIIKY